MRAYSHDLRQRILACKKRGGSSAEVGKRFAVAVRTVERYWQRYREQGHCRVGKVGGHLRSRLTGHEATISAWIEEQSDLSLEELRLRCQKQLGVKLTVSALWYRLKALGLSYKKSDARRRATAS